eukprot:g973.t1
MTALFFTLVATIHVVGIFAAQSSTPIFPDSVPVFYSGLNKSKCFRIPSIIQTSKGTLLAFAENRISDCGDNGNEHDLVLRRSFDGGKSWGPMILVQKGTTPCDGCPKAISNPNPVEVFDSSGKSFILLHYDTLNNPNSAHHGLDMQIMSDDEGLTWTSPQKLSYPPNLNKGGLIGPSVGIQSTKTGSIYFSTMFGGEHFLYWSTDYTKTWQSSKPIKGLGECSIAFLDANEQSNIIMNCRIGSGKRAQVIWDQNGKQVGDVTYPKGLAIDPGCQGSIINGGNNVLYTSNANSTTSRSHMALKTSSDGGVTWSDFVEVYKGPSAYSQLVSIDQSTLGLLFECDTFFGTMFRRHTMRSWSSVHRHRWFSSIEVNAPSTTLQKRFGNVIGSDDSTFHPTAMKTFEAWHEVVDIMKSTNKDSVDTNTEKAKEKLEPYIADDVIFRPPTYFKPWVGKKAFLIILPTVGEVFGSSFVYRRQFVSQDGFDWALEFETQILDHNEEPGQSKPVLFEGIDLVKLDRETGLIKEFTVMGRPPNAVKKLGGIMLRRAGPKLAGKQIEEKLSSFKSWFGL